MIYISGPMSGMPDLNYPLFNATAAKLRAEGLQVINPAEITVEHGVKWELCLRRDIRALMDCDSIAMLPGWEVSKGARLEHHIAVELGFEVIYLKPPSPVAIAEEAQLERE
jgi:hypothetical protein